MCGGEKTLYENLITDGNITNLLNFFVFCLLGMVFIWYLLNFGEKEVMRAWGITNTMQAEMIMVLDNLEEVIITKNTDEIKFRNA
jgi:hypothetical protein